MNASDHPYKLIHADPRMLEDALRGFVAPEWANQLDFTTLAPLDKERIGPALSSRIGDKVWRVERRDGAPLANGRRPYVNILFEFQSVPDPDMAWRMHEYLYLLELNQRDIAPGGEPPAGLPGGGHPQRDDAVERLVRPLRPPAGAANAGRPRPEPVAQLLGR